MMTDKKIDLILDTDIGDDIDDAFALALALKSEEINLLGVTTVFRNSIKRARMAAALANEYGRTMEAYAGIDEPITQKAEKIVEEEVYKKETLDEHGAYLPPQYFSFMEAYSVQQKNAVDFIIESAFRYKNELQILCIGPLTNLAIALRLKPEIKSQIKKVTVMGGCFHEKKPEWNILCDPESASVVFTSGIPVYAVGLDVTEQCPLSDKMMAGLRELHKNGSKILVSMLDKWFEHYHRTRPVLHDPLAVCSLLQPGLLQFRKRKVRVGTEGGIRGMTLPSENGEGTEIWIAESVDANLFFEIFTRRVLDGKGA